uniref:PAX-interacting protein 1 n=1 Tax=Fopius arisanus TaxID=64838 RepID=A0A0C9PRK5_9HYME
MGDIRAGLEEIKLDEALFADVKYYVSGEADPKGLTFYVTPSVVPSPTAFSEIIESAGGTMEKCRRSLVQIQEMNSGGKLNYIIVTQENDLHLLADVLQANINVFSAEVVLRSVARQNFQIDTNQL